MKNRILLLAKVTVSVITLYLIIQKIDWNQLAISIKQGNLFYIFMGGILGLLFNLIKFTKWHYLINAGSQTHTYWYGAKSYMLGNALGLVTPMRAGDLGRALFFPKEDQTRILGLTIIDRGMDLAAILILCIGGSFALVNRGFGLLVVLSCILSVFALYTPRYLAKVFKRSDKPGYIRAKINKLIKTLELLNVRTITFCLILSLMAFILTIFEFYFVVTAFEEIALISTFLITPLITLSALVPITFMGLGVREGLSILLFTMFGISAGTAFSAAFLCFVINNVSISLIGAIYLFKIELPSKKTDIEKIPLSRLSGDSNSFD